MAGVSGFPQATMNLDPRASCVWGRGSGFVYRAAIGAARVYPVFRFGLRACAPLSLCVSVGFRVRLELQ